MTEQQIERRRERDRLYKRKLRLTSPEYRRKCKLSRAKWGNENKEYLRVYSSKWRQKRRDAGLWDKEKAKERTRLKRLRDPQYEIEYRSRPNVKRATSLRTNRWRLQNRDRERRNHRLAIAALRASNHEVRILGNLRCRITNALRRRKANKNSSTNKLLGCSINDFCIYLESQFESGMTWDNYGSAWHVDHIMPCAIFDLSKPEHQKRCFHFSNLRPLWASENMSKSSKLVTNQFRLI